MSTHVHNVLQLKLNRVKYRSHAKNKRLKIQQQLGLKLNYRPSLTRTLSEYYPNWLWRLETNQDIAHTGGFKVMQIVFCYVWNTKKSFKCWGLCSQNAKKNRNTIPNTCIRLDWTIYILLDKDFFLVHPHSEWCTCTTLVLMTYQVISQKYIM